MKNAYFSPLQNTNEPYKLFLEVAHNSWLDLEWFYRRVMIKL